MVAVLDGDTTYGDQLDLVVEGLPLSVTAPAEVDVGETFDVAVGVTNPLTVTLSDLALSLEVSSAFTITGSTAITVPVLGPDDQFVHSLTLTAGAPGDYLLGASVESSAVGLSQTSGRTRVLGGPDLRAVLDIPAKVVIGESFVITGTVANAGDKGLTGAWVRLSLSPGLTTDEPITIVLGDVEPGSQVVTTWQVVAQAAGGHTILLEANDDIGRMTSDEEVVAVASYDHTIALIADPPAVGNQAPVDVTLRLRNPGATQDRVRLMVHVDDPGLAATLYSDGAPVFLDPVMVPPEGELELRLHVVPTAGAEGTVFVEAVSDLDPTAVATAAVTVREWKLYLPLTLKNHPAF